MSRLLYEYGGSGEAWWSIRYDADGTMQTGRFTNRREAERFARCRTCHEIDCPDTVQDCHAKGECPEAA